MKLLKAIISDLYAIIEMIVIGIFSFLLVTLIIVTIKVLHIEDTSIEIGIGSFWCLLYIIMGKMLIRIGTKNSH